MQPDRDEADSQALVQQAIDAGLTGVIVDGIDCFGPPVRGRGCGSCTACCTQVPVIFPEGEKPANVRCQHQRAKGCGIYANRPAVCRAWSCRWLFDADTGGLRRPDHSGYVIDSMPDTVIAQDDGRERIITVIQVWCDPKRRDAHRDPALRAYLAGMFERHNCLAIVRWSDTDGMVLMPPASNSAGEWVEHVSQMNTAQVMRAKLEAAGVDAGWRHRAALLEERVGQ